MAEIFLKTCISIWEVIGSYSVFTEDKVIVNMLKLLESVLRIDARKSFSVGSVVRSLNG